MSLKGIDVSHYQSRVDWSAVARGGTAFAFAKASEGSNYVDPEFERNWVGMSEAGVVRGAYHFARPGRDPVTQAEHFASIVGALGPRDLPPVLDLEEDDGHSRDEVLAWARAFLERAEALFERRLLLYTGGFWRFRLSDVRDPYFGLRPLWLAAYNQNPIVPASWEAWTFWQFSDGSQNGGVPIPGIRGPVDQNVFAGDAAELARFCLDAASVAPSPAPAPLDWPGVYFVWPHTPPVAGDAVKRWQTRLAELGYVLVTDGVYGPRSKAACSAYQKEHGLHADGIVGPATWKRCFLA